MPVTTSIKNRKLDKPISGRYIKKDIWGFGRGIIWGMKNEEKVLKKRKEREKLEKKKREKEQKIVDSICEDTKSGKLRWLVKITKEMHVIFLGISTIEDKIVVGIRRSRVDGLTQYLVESNDWHEVLYLAGRAIEKEILANNPQLLSEEKRIKSSDKEDLNVYIKKYKAEVQNHKNRIKQQLIERKKQLEEQQKEKRKQLEEQRAERRKKELERKYLMGIPTEGKQNSLVSIDPKEQERLQKLPQIGIRDFVVRRTVFRCMQKKHKIKNIVAAVNIIDKNNQISLTRINAGYCETCKVYFILESSYEKLRKKGIPICRVTDEKTYESSHFANSMMLAQESILMQFGYNVNQAEGLTETRRHKILAVLIDNKILSKSEIISYLDFFIRQRQYQSKFEKAIEKWEIDREFVENYRIGEYNLIRVNSIYRK